MLTGWTAGGLASLLEDLAPSANSHPPSLRFILILDPSGGGRSCTGWPATQLVGAISSDLRVLGNVILVWFLMSRHNFQNRQGSGGPTSPLSLRLSPQPHPTGSSLSGATTVWHDGPVLGKIPTAGFSAPARRRGAEFLWQTKCLSMRLTKRRRA